VFLVILTAKIIVIIVPSHDQDNITVSWSYMVQLVLHGACTAMVQFPGPPIHKMYARITVSHFG
jgi:hypothetical protein